MATNESKVVTDGDGNDVLGKDSMECPICLQTCIHPAKLPCGHIFCFLCVKGVTYKNHKCAMCRRDIPLEFLDHPQLVHTLCKSNLTGSTYQWFYEGRNGWWQYDERTTQDIEDAYKKGEKSCIILVAGYVYTVDFEAMIQQRQNDFSKKRRIKRDLPSVPKKGIAGLRISSSLVPEVSNITRLAEDVILQQRYSNIIPVITATDAASRIASDIIGSTLTNVDEFVCPNNLETNNREQELLEEAEILLNETVGANLVPTVNQSTSGIFSHTLENLRTFSLSSVINSSDSEDANN